MSETMTPRKTPSGGVLGNAPESALAKVVRVMRVDKIGAVYVLILICILFSILAPDTFPTLDTARSILNENATTAVIAMALVVPLATGVFDLSIGNVVALTTVTIAWLVVEKGVSIELAIIGALILGLGVGVMNSVVVVGLGIDSFIATLGTGAVLQAVNLLISNEEVVTSPELGTDLGNIALANIGGIQTSVLVAILVAIGLWLLLDHTVTGRRLYATGFNAEAARLSGVRVKRLRTFGLFVSAFVAGIAGIMVISRVGAGSPDVGPSYLLDAFAAAFLGATQLRKGRFNPFGTIIAVLVLGAGSNGMTQLGAPSWTLQLYVGLVLIVALALTRLERQQARGAGATPVDPAEEPAADAELGPQGPGNEDTSQRRGR